MRGSATIAKVCALLCLPVFHLLAALLLCSKLLMELSSWMAHNSSDGKAPSLVAWSFVQPDWLARQRRVGVTLQKEQALLTGPSEASSSSCLAADLEKQELLARIHELEAAGQNGPATWEEPPDLADDAERARYACVQIIYFSRCGPTQALFSSLQTIGCQSC